MGSLQNNVTHRGADAQLRLFEGGQPQDIVEAEEIEIAFQLHTLENQLLSQGYTTRQTHPDGVQLNFTGVKKSNQFLAKIKVDIKTATASGLPLPAWSGLVKYRDLNTNTIEEVKVVNAAITELKPFASGKINDRQMEGFTIIGQLG